MVSATSITAGSTLRPSPAAQPCGGRLIADGGGDRVSDAVLEPRGVVAEHQLDTEPALAVELGFGTLDEFGGVPRRTGGDLDSGHRAATRGVRQEKVGVGHLGVPQPVADASGREGQRDSELPAHLQQLFHRRQLGELTPLGRPPRILPGHLVQRVKHPVQNVERGPRDRCIRPVWPLPHRMCLARTGHPPVQRRPGDILLVIGVGEDAERATLPRRGDAEKSRAALAPVEEGEHAAASLPAGKYEAQIVSTRHQPCGR
ncbi:hypothetical protein ABZW18_33470 [Streptomyces sp. NPDC004647]|uniref:hypothetical protein n=1 Tax=Streptomyces sp. NPDC004647 TaxID=3154671 RepID=UPI0033A6A6F4